MVVARGLLTLLTLEARLVVAVARPNADATVERARASCLAAAMEIRLTATEENIVIMKVEGGVVIKTVRRQPM